MRGLPALRSISNVPPQILQHRWVSTSLNLPIVATGVGSWGETKPEVRVASLPTKKNRVRFSADIRSRYYGFSEGARVLTRH
jgi:hypothetical protein